MRDKRPVDELTIEELERVLAIKRRERRQSQLNRLKSAGRVVSVTTTNGHNKPAPEPAVVDEPPRAAPPSLTMPRFEDDPDEFPTGREGSEHVWRRFVDTSLFLVEITAVVGLLFIAVNLVMAIGKLEDETREAQAITNETRMAGVPTLEPTPQLRVNINDYVLPGGHTFTEDGAAIPNLEELSGIPEHLMPIVQQQLFTPIIERPPQTPQTALTVNIPAIGVDQVIIQGSDVEALRLGVGQVLNGAIPSNAQGNVVLAAHNDIYGEIFRDLDQLSPGDQIFIQTQNRTYTYQVTHWERVQPNDVHVMENQGDARVTLISCYPYRVNTERIVVHARRIDV